MKKNHKENLIKIFNKELIRGLKSDKILSKDLKLNLKPNLEKFNKKQNKIIDLIINLKYLDHIEICLKNSKSQKFQKNILKKKLIKKYKKTYQILQKAKNPSKNLIDFLDAIKSCNTLLNEKNSFFKTSVFFNKNDFLDFKNQEEVLEISKHKIWDKIKGYLNKDVKFEIELDKEYVISIIWVTVKECC